MSKEASFKLKAKGPASLVKAVAGQALKIKATPAVVKKKV